MVPNLPPEPSAREIAEHELTGHAVCRSWCRHCFASEGRMRIPHKRCRKSSTGCVGATVADKKGASDYASSFLTAFIKSPGFKRILVRSDSERSLLSLIERVTCNLTGVEWVLMTSPEGNHQANGFAEVGVREIRAQTRILRSQLEQRLGSRIDEKRSVDVVDTTSCSELCVQLQNHGRWSNARPALMWKHLETSSGGVWRISALQTIR